MNAPTKIAPAITMTEARRDATLEESMNFELPVPHLARVRDFRRAGRNLGVAFAKRFIDKTRCIELNGHLTEEAAEKLGNAVRNDMAGTVQRVRTAGYPEGAVLIFEAAMLAGFKRV